MSKECWKPGNMVYPLPAVMVSCGHTEEEHNIITIAWTGTVNTNPAMVYISVRKERHSYDIIKRTGDFVINLTTEDLAFATDWCGVRSGRKFDKFKEMKLTKESAKIVKSPLIKESPINIECVVKDIVELGSHDMFVAEVVNINYDTKYIDPNTDEFSLASARPIVYSHGRYFSLGKKIGKFGYSVEKKKKR
jgi:flavin reductase (DIM6/NTAB) family NADH-FMN oxidoreductase RutF